MEFQAGIHNDMAEVFANLIREKLNITGLDLELSDIQAGLEAGKISLFDPLINVKATVAVSIPMSSISALVKSLKEKGGNYGK